MMTRVTVQLAFLLSLACAAAAAPVVDQDAVPGGRSYGVIGGEIERAQSFTAGSAGQLTSFEVTLARDGVDGGEGSLTWGIYALGGGVPSETPFAQGLQLVTFELGNREQVVSVDVSASAIFVAPGEVLAFGIGNGAAHSVDDPWFVYGKSAGEGELYSGGMAFLRITDGSQPAFATWTADPPDFDWTFRTFVDPEAVPEPHALLLAALAAACLAARRRH